MFDIYVLDSKNCKKIIQVEKTYTISKVKDVIKKKQKIKGNIELCFNGDILEDNDTLEYYEILPYSTLIYLGEYLAGGGDFGLNMADISNEKGLVKKNYSKDAPKWNISVKGLNVSGICKNKDCEAYNKEVDCKIGLKIFDLVRDADEIKCPICSKEIEPTTCVFCECEYKLKGKKKINGETSKVDTDWKRVEKDYEYYDPKKSGIVTWLMLVIETRPL